MLIAIKVVGEPDFYPDHLAVDALPPEGSSVEIDSRTFTVAKLTLKSRPALTNRRSYYEVTLTGPQETPTSDA